MGVADFLIGHLDLSDAFSSTFGRLGAVLLGPQASSPAG